MKIRVGISEAPYEEPGYGFIHGEPPRKRIRKFGSWDEAKLVAQALGVPLEDVAHVFVLKPQPMSEDKVEFTYS